MFDFLNRSEEKLTSLLALLVNKQIINKNEASWILNEIPSKDYLTKELSQIDKDALQYLSYEEYEEIRFNYLKHKGCEQYLTRTGKHTFICPSCNQTFGAFTLKNDVVDIDHDSINKKLAEIVGTRKQD